MKDLIKLPGVARKTANVVLWGGFGINEGLAVDTHVKRISGRLGLTKHTDPVDIEKDLVKLFPQSEWGKVCLLYTSVELPRPKEKLPYPPAGINRQALTDFIGTLWDMKK